MHHSGAIERDAGARAKGLRHFGLPLALIVAGNSVVWRETVQTNQD
jgi:hypothetical protein